MSEPASSDDVARAVFGALGLELPDNTKEFTLKVSYSNGVELTVVTIPRPVQLDENYEIVNESKKYKLVEAE